MIFINPAENRLRAGWRILFTTAFIFSLLIVFSLFVQSRATLMAGLAVIVLLVLLFSSVALDKRPFRDFGFELSGRWIVDFFAGNIIAILSISFIVLMKVWAGWLAFNSVTTHIFSRTILLELTNMLILMTAISVWEEAYFRGYLITNLKEGFHLGKISKKWVMVAAVMAAALIFGIAHANNPNATILSIINISAAGIVLAYPYIKTVSMAIPVGMHLSWNFFQGTVFGLPVSGVDMEETIVTTTVTGPDLFTGGMFGPEGGLLGLTGLIVMVMISYLYLFMFYKK